jgi:hypothetical protein
MAGRVKHAERSRKGHDRSGMYRKYVTGRSSLYVGSGFSMLHKLSNVFKHQGR